MNIVIPANGTGQRFVAAGYTVLKPLLPLGKKRLIQLAVDSVVTLGELHYLVSMEVIQHPASQGLLPSGCWHVLMLPTEGSLQTVLKAKGCLDNPDEVLVMDCDSVINPQELSEALQVFRSSSAAGGVTLRKTTDPMCSYAEVDAEWWVTQTRENDPFTSWSTTGPYWFRSGKQFLEAARKADAAQHTSISPVYNYLAGRTKAVPVASFRHLGTPEAYEAAKQEWVHVH